MNSSQPPLPPRENLDREWRQFHSFVANLGDVRRFRETVRGRMSPTPRELLYREHSLALYHYPGPTPEAGTMPLLVVPSLINKPAIMDLLPGESFIAGMLARGIPVYMLEWGEPLLGQKDFSLAYYLKNYLARAVKRTLSHSRAPRLALGGYCLGGGLSLLHAAIDGGDTIGKLITMVTPINFFDRGMLSFWARPGHFPVDRLVDRLGNMPAEFFSLSFPWLMPMAWAQKWRTIYEKHRNLESLESFFALDIWVNENIDFPGEVYREILKQGYQANCLVETKGWPLTDGTRISLDNLRMPLFNAVAQYDNVSPAESCAILEKLIPRNKQVKTQTYPVGHLGIALGKGKGGASTPEIWDDIANFVKGPG